MKRFFTLLLISIMIVFSVTACGQENQPADEETASPVTVLEDGEYEAEFDTDSNMFHVNEACEGKGILTVKDGRMTIHVSLVSKNILNMYVGTAEEAEKNPDNVLEPTTDSVTYSDGYTEDVYGFDIPVPALNEEFNVAIYGKKGTWYTHKVSVLNPVKKGAVAETGQTAADLKLADGVYTAEVKTEGGSGKAAVLSPCEITVSNGQAVARIVWSSDKYDYMIADTQKYEPVTVEGGSTFEIPVPVFDAGIAVTGDTTAMSTPHEIEYTILFDSATLKEK